MKCFCKEKEIILLFYSYIMTTGVLLGMYWLEKDNDLFLNSILFFSVVILNRVLDMFQKRKGRFIKILYVAEMCFVLFLMCLSVFQKQYFVYYKLLILPSIILAIVQSFTLRKHKREE